MTARQADLALVVATAIWASTYVVVKDAVEKDLSPLLYIGVRMLLGAVFLVMLRPSFLRDSRDRAALIYGAVLGGFMFMGLSTQTIGLRETTPARSGFISSLAFIFVPVVETIVRRRLPARAVLAALPLCVVGLLLLSDPWSMESPYPVVCVGLNRGDLWTLAGTGFFTGQLVLSERASQKATVGGLAVVQVVACGVLSLVACGTFEVTGVVGELRFALTVPAFFALALTSLFATSIAFILWLSAQKVVSASRSALIFTLEPVLAAALSRALGREVLSGTQSFGGALIVLALLLAELRHVRKDDQI